MSNQELFGALVFLCSVVMAMCLKVLPLWPALQVWNPDWVLLVLMYWVLSVPYKCGVFNAWIVGIFTDVLTGRPFGQYALVYALISYVCLKFYKRVRHFPLLQQGVFIFGCLLAAQIGVFWIDSIHKPARFQWEFILPTISGTLIWPVAGMLLRHIYVNRRVR